MPKRSSKDINETAFSIVQQVAAQSVQTPEQPPKNPAAVALGRLGGAKGGKARAAKLTKEQRSEIATKAAVARWSNLAQIETREKELEEELCKLRAIKKYATKFGTDFSPIPPRPSSLPNRPGSIPAFTRLCA